MVTFFASSVLEGSKETS